MPFSTSGRQRALDEPELRALVGSVSMPGAVAVRFAREPDYFLGASIMGDPCDVFIARQRLDGALAGIACRAERLAFVNGTRDPRRLYRPDQDRARVPRTLADPSGSAVAA